MTRQTMTAALAAAWERFGHRPATSWRGHVLTYGALADAVHRVADGYARLGVATGDRVICKLPNRPELVISAAAAWVRGAIHIGAAKDLTAAEMAWLVRHTEAAAVVLADDEVDLSGTVEAIRQVRPESCVLVCPSDGNPIPPGCQSFAELAASAPAPRPGSSGSVPAEDDPAVVFFTSGTTGAPKGVISCHGEFLGSCTRLVQALALMSPDVHLGQLPLSHRLGFGLAMTALLTGGKLLLLERFSPGHVLDLVSTERISVLHGAPAHFSLLLDRLDRSRHDVSSLRIGTGSSASFSPKLLAKILDDLGMSFILSYGCSEGLGWSTDDREDMLTGSVGRPPPGLVRIVDADRHEVAVGEMGEVEFRKIHAIRYWGENGEPSGSSTDCWHPTGDVGRLDANGRLYVFGKLKNQINRGGMKVDIGEVEARLLAYPGLADAAVIPSPDPFLGEIVCACVVPGSGAPPALAELRHFLGTTLASHKLPEELRLVPRIPRTPLGKVDRPTLVELAIPAPDVERVNR